ncbi:hypothetical protein Rxycam_00472 [Rubrobacter xylanophilus DSM 9941]|uniref:RsiG family protein n=1 Tax=Rubrobacter xylanophilus TaxID=49319 RepID=UPI001C643561|nr:hypothetical protein [Rubrobacter xylanophilus]QYJ14670.1 hypothetical protein Rxycam_00472 [Rubrobacter xylanophilus DSM 9941]
MDEHSGGFEWEGALDLTALSPDELRRELAVLEAEERELSRRRRLLHGRIDLLRAELVRRGEAALSPEELARVLAEGDSLGGGRT